jgi:hypothetical protein
LQQARINEIERHIRNQCDNATSNQDSFDQVILVDLKHKKEIFQKGQLRSLLTIALCIGGIAANFFPAVCGVIAVVSIVEVLAAQRIIQKIKKIIFANQDAQNRSNFTRQRMQAFHL